MKTNRWMIFFFVLAAAMVVVSVSLLVPIDRGEEKTADLAMKLIDENGYLLGLGDCAIDRDELLSSLQVSDEELFRWYQACHREYSMDSGEEKKFQILYEENRERIMADIGANVLGDEYLREVVLAKYRDCVPEEFRDFCEVQLYNVRHLGLGTIAGMLRDHAVYEYVKCLMAYWNGLTVTDEEIDRFNYERGTFLVADKEGKPVSLCFEDMQMEINREYLNSLQILGHENKYDEKFMGKYRNVVRFYLLGYKGEKLLLEQIRRPRG